VRSPCSPCSPLFPITAAAPHSYLFIVDDHDIISFEFFELDPPQKEPKTVIRLSLFSLGLILILILSPSSVLIDAGYYLLASY